jgi:hypothetical protein
VKAKVTLIWSILIVMLFAVAADAQNTNPSKPIAKITPGQAGGNPAKLPPTFKGMFIPDLRLRGSESVEVNAVVPKSYHKVTFLFQNWDKFPAEMLQPTAEPPSLPPNPCRQMKTSTRLFAILHSKAGQTLDCTALKPREDFYFLLEKEKPLPKFVYVEVVDRLKGTSYKSSLVSPSSGATK